MTIGDFAGVPIIVAVIFRQDDLVQHCPSLLVIDPQQDLRLGHPGVDVKVVAVQGDTPIAVRRAGKEGVGTFLRAHLLGLAPALRRPQDLHGEGWETLVGPQTLLGGRVGGLDEGLVTLF